jgi:3-(3-hydroxy-phenyl)propionate hydroxylase
VGLRQGPNAVALSFPKLRAYQARVMMIEHEVVISEGGPTGLTLAAELALAGIDVAIVERHSSQDLMGARAGGLHVRTIEVFDQRGIADRFLAVGQKHPMAITFRKHRLDPNIDI